MTYDKMNFYFRSEIALLLLWDNVTLNSDLKKKKKKDIDTKSKMDACPDPYSIILFTSTHAHIHTQW